LDSGSKSCGLETGKNNKQMQETAAAALLCPCNFKEIDIILI